MVPEVEVAVSLAAALLELAVVAASWEPEVAAASWGPPVVLVLSGEEVDVSSPLRKVLEAVPAVEVSWPAAQMASLVAVAFYRNEPKQVQAAVVCRNGLNRVERFPGSRPL